ncbi:MAG: hypothetical protein L3J37_13165 [Rhodobacteraceae bacterium]|nr:hypothetical protein [Paracoccaceae bacterium]
MELSYKSTINVPHKFAFERATNFEKFEIEGFGKLAPFEPVSDIRAPEIGARWKTSSEFQGRPRRFSLQLFQLEPSQKMVLGNKSEKYDVEAHFDFEDIAPEETGFSFLLVAKAQSITARLILQTIQLARGRIESSMKADFETMAQKMEAAYRTES